MNRAELAALLAANPPVPSSSSPIMLQDHMQNLITSSPSSPRLAFQSRVQHLKQQPSSSGTDLGTHPRRHSELEHVSSLRVTHRRSLSAEPASRFTPDFWVEEQQAWSNRSPKARMIPPPSPNARPVLPPCTRVAPTAQPGKQVGERVPLRTFEPLQSLVDAEERPKTSRGPQKLEILREENEEDSHREIEGEEEGNEVQDNETLGPSTVTDQTGRNSKFIEGSMNDRSFGIASSWFQDGPIDGDKPLPPTPATKHVTFSCTPVGESLDEPPIHLTTTKRKDRRGLRKSISHFNFQTFSEKIKIFGGACNEVSFESAERKKSQTSDSRIEILTERKRKANAAYAAQFGFKKPKVVAQPDGAAPSPNVGGNHGRGRKVEQASHSFRTSKPSATSPFPNPGPPRKKSRRDLERENAELRAQLAQQDHHQPQPIATQEQFVGANVVMLSPGKRRGTMDEDVPPVPQLAGRGVLEVLVNSKNDLKAPCLELESESLGPDESKHAPDARQPWEWPEDVF